MTELDCTKADFKFALNTLEMTCADFVDEYCDMESTINFDKLYFCHLDQSLAFIPIGVRACKLSH